MATITQIEYVLHVDRLKHFGKAAKAANISQPTLSQQIQKLEDDLGIVIFDRLQKPVILTERGKVFVEQARRVLREHQRLVHLAKQSTDESGGVRGQFRLAIIPTVSSSLLPLFIQKFSSDYPNVELTIEEMKTELSLSALAEDRVDGAILATPTPTSGLKEHPLYYEPFHAYFSEGHRLLKKESVHRSDLDGSEMWVLQDGNCFKDQVASFCPIPGAVGPVRFQSGSLETLVNLVRKGQGFTMIPALMTAGMGQAEQKGHVRRFRGAEPVREISLVYRRDHWKLEIISALEKTIAKSLPSVVSTTRGNRQTVLEYC
ncbi:MAG: LysR family transcriptional regulator [Bdellovibrionales bacterium]|nr:LysR family transcriptional regulator [Bdellovibrionales bacterium]